MKYLKKWAVGLLVLLLALGIFPQVQSEEVVVDSAMTLEESLAGSKAPAEILGEQVLLNVEYLSFDGKIHRGQLVLRKDRVEEIRDAFAIMIRDGFPVEKCIPVVNYSWDDDASMADNNTSMFNYRNIAGTKRLSRHSWGVAIDINPGQNPAVYPSGKVSPPGATYKPQAPGTLTRESSVTRFFIEHGWTWGGNWTHVLDWQHFEKP